MKRVPCTPRDLVIKGKVPPRSASVALRQLNPIHIFFFEALIYCAYSEFGKYLEI